MATDVVGDGDGAGDGAGASDGDDDGDGVGGDGDGAGDPLCSWRTGAPKHEHSLTVTIAVIHDVHVLLLLQMVPLYFISFYFVSTLFHLTTSGDPRADEKTRAPSHALAPCALP